MDHDEGNEDHPQQRELIGCGKDLGEFHAGSLGACNEDALRPAGGSAAMGSRPVFARKRCESDGKLPSGGSRSTRSIRCMGKNTIAGVKGSPSRTMTVRSSKEASSAPLRLSPSGASARIIPQNFSRGLLKVTMTSAPEMNTSRPLEGEPVCLFSMKRL